MKDGQEKRRMEPNPRLSNKDSKKTGKIEEKMGGRPKQVCKLRRVKRDERK